MWKKSLFGLTSLIFTIGIGHLAVADGEEPAAGPSTFEGHCKPAYQGGLEACQTMDAQITTSAVGAGQSVAGSESAEARASGNAALNQAASEAAVEAARQCSSLYQQCLDACDAAYTHHLGVGENKLAEESSAYGNSQCVEIRAKAERFYATASSSGQSAMDSARTAESIGDSETGKKGKGGGFSMGDALNYGILAATIGGAAECAFGDCFGMIEEEDKDDEDEDEDDESAEEDAEPVDCSIADNFEKRDCRDDYISKCMSDPNTDNCEPFTTLYCSSHSSAGSETTEESASAEDSSSNEQESASTATTVVSTEPGSGIGSPYCERHHLLEFCQSSDNGDCPSCIQLAMQANPVCQENASNCMPAISNEQMQEYVQVCPSDPYYATAEYLNSRKMAAGTRPPMISSDPNTKALNEISPGGDGSAVDYSDAVEDRGGVAVTFSRVPASVAPAGGASIFEVSQQIYQERCDQGLLNNCEEDTGSPGGGAVQ